jgi:hypothetical protein
MGVGGKPQIALAESAGESFVCRPVWGSASLQNAREDSAGAAGAASDPSRSILPGAFWDRRRVVVRRAYRVRRGKGSGVRALAYVRHCRQSQKHPQARP